MTEQINQESNSVETPKDATEVFTEMLEDDLLVDELSPEVDLFSALLPFPKGEWLALRILIHK